MPRIKPRERGIVLFMVLATVLIVIILANVVLSIISSQSRLTHHQVARTRAYYAAQAGMNLALDKLMSGAWGPHATAMRYYCINGAVDAGVTCIETINDPIASGGIPYNVQIAVYPRNNPGIDGTTRLDIRVDYTYTP